MLARMEQRSEKGRREQRTDAHASDPRTSSFWGANEHVRECRMSRCRRRRRRRLLSYQRALCAVSGRECLEVRLGVVCAHETGAIAKASAKREFWAPSSTEAGSRSGGPLMFVLF